MLAGEPVFGAELAIGSPLIGEIFSLAGFDFVQVDYQHGMWDDKTAMESFHNILLGPATPAVRVPDNDYAAIGRLLDRGAQSIIVPMVNSPAEAHRAVEAVRYPPLGSRSGGAPTGRMVYNPQEYNKVANDEILLMVQIETKQAVEQAEEILSVEGVDGCMIGPGDMARTYGWDLSDPKVREKHHQTILEVRDVCLRVGKLPGIATGGPAAETFLKEGFLFVLAVGDYAYVAQGAAETVKWLKTVKAELKAGPKEGPK
jgi:2-keto-3-deoxy-L-rhamnonate aldolase RhmA